MALSSICIGSLWGSFVHSFKLERIISERDIDYRGYIGAVADVEEDRSQRRGMTVEEFDTNIWDIRVGVQGKNCIMIQMFFRTDEPLIFLKIVRFGQGVEPLLGLINDPQIFIDQGADGQGFEHQFIAMPERVSKWIGNLDLVGADRRQGHCLHKISQKRHCRKRKRVLRCLQRAEICRGLVQKRCGQSNIPF